MNVPIEPLDTIAIFCDFDGTLVDIAPTPDKVHLSSAHHQTIATLHEKCQWAFAVVSGRPLQEIQQHLPLPHFSGAGCHGAEFEYDGQKQESEPESPEFVRVKQQLKHFSEQQQLIWEDKGHSFAIHFRLAPDLEPSIDQFIDQVLAQQPAFKKLFGKAVREVKPSSFDKGSAIARLMKTPIFTNKKPYYFGDDVTDEDAFAYINRIGGVTIKIGSGTTQAKYHLDSPDRVIEFFERMLREHHECNNAI